MSFVKNYDEYWSFCTIGMMNLTDFQKIIFDKNHNYCTKWFVFFVKYLKHSKENWKIITKVVFCQKLRWILAFLCDWNGESNRFSKNNFWQKSHLLDKMVRFFCQILQKFDRKLKTNNKDGLLSKITMNIGLFVRLEWWI